MNMIMTSLLGGYKKINGKRIPDRLRQQNGLLDNIKSIWPYHANGLIIASNPNAYDSNDGLCACLKESFFMSGLPLLKMKICDDRNFNTFEDLKKVNVVILVGGHVPTQNQFMKKIHLKEKLQDYKGIIIAWSAGSMNCAHMVYAAPELNGEAINPFYERFLPGLGLTDINIFPHLQMHRGEYLDGFRLLEDIVFVDSLKHEIIALNDGSYIMMKNNKTILYGEAYKIKNKKMWQICKENESIVF